MFLLILFLLLQLPFVEASLPQYDTASFSKRLDHLLIVLTLAVRLNSSIKLRSMLKVKPHEMKREGYYTKSLDTVKRSLLMLHRVLDLLMSGEDTDKRDFIYYFHMVLNVTKIQAEKHVDKCLITLSTISGVPRCLFPIVPATRIYMLGKLLIKRGQNDFINAKRGLNIVLDNIIGQNLFGIKMLRPAKLSFKRVILVEKKNMTKIFRAMKKEFVRSSQLEVWMHEVHQRKLIVYGKSDNDIHGTQRLASYSYVTDTLTESEHELPVDVFILGPYADQHSLFGRKCVEYDVTKLEKELDANDLERLRIWEKPDSNFMSSGNRENRKRVLRGFKKNPFSLQINGLPKEEVARQWESQIRKNENL
eukprot:scaffold8384_cov22-Cyclotella_meneghiniana.AAC.1